MIMKLPLLVHVFWTGKPEEVGLKQRSITAYDAEMSAYFTVRVSTRPGIGDPSL
jgi:hypothetical protein